MSRHQFQVWTVAVCVSCSVAAQCSYAQTFTPTAGPTTTAAARPSIGAAKSRRQQAKQLGYQLRAPAAEAIAAGRVANGQLKVAWLIGQLQAKGDLRQAEAQYAEVCQQSGQQKIAARHRSADMLKDEKSWQQAQVSERARARQTGALKRVEEVRQGNWPLALQGEQHRSLREELSAALAGQADLVATAPHIDIQHIRSLVAQLRRQLGDRIHDMNPRDYIQAKQFLDGLKGLTNVKLTTDSDA